MPRKRSNGDASPDTSMFKRRKTSESAAQTPTEAPPNHALDHEEKAELRQWLDDRDRDPEVDSIFTMKTTPVSRKTKTSEVEQLHLSGRDHLTVAYVISREWGLLRRYKRFTLLNGETYPLGTCVFIKHAGSGDGTMDLKNQWKAQVLEIRGLDQDHVYLLVAYLQNPHELPSGPAEHHAPHELVPSNELAIVDALTVNGGFDIVHWDEWNEDDDETPPLCPDSYFWRQTYNVHSRTLSPLRRMCACKTPRNPSRAMIKCSNCAEWLHEACIIDKAKGRTVAPSSRCTKIGGKKGQRKSATPAKKADDDEEENEKVEVVLLEEDGKPKLLVHGPAGNVREEEICCLLCSKSIG